MNPSGSQVHTNSRMSALPTISVIIPCYNHARFLSCAVNSVLSQTFTDWEAIIVDDGSTDNTRAIAAQFADPRIRYTYQDNHGLSAARNTGIRAAQGLYLAFLDADDEWDPRFLEVTYRGVASSATMVVTLACFIDEQGAPLPAQGGQVLAPHEFRPRLLEGGFFPLHAALVRAESVRSVGLFDEMLTSLEDWDLWLRITAIDESVLTIPESLAHYRISTGSMSTNAARMHANRIAVLAKHFGPPIDEPANWPTEKQRVYAFAYRSAALGYLMQQEPDAAWRWLTEAARTWPPILSRLDTFYEFALGDQPRGYRGEVRGLNVAASGADLLHRLDALLGTAPAEVTAQRGPAYGNAYLALGILADQAGDWSLARGYLLRGLCAYPQLRRNRSVKRRLVKVLIGKRAVTLMRMMARKM